MDTTDDAKNPRWDRGSESTFMTEHAGYVMARKKGAAPFLMSKREWLALPTAAFGREVDAAYSAALKG